MSMASLPASNDINSKSEKIQAFQGHGDGVDAIVKTVRAGRRDGRTHNEMRAMVMTHDALRQADGSARLKIGGTDVLVAVYGPIDGPIQRQEPDQIHIHVTFRRRTPENTNSTEDSIITKHIRFLIQDVLLTHLFPRKALVIAIQVLSDHGALIATAFNTTVVALLHANVPMKIFPVAACVATRSRHLTVDPLLVEENESDAVITAVFDSASATTKDSDNSHFLSVLTQGHFEDQKVFNAALNTCRKLACKTRSFLSTSLEQKASRKFVWNSSS